MEVETGFDCVEEEGRVMMRGWDREGGLGKGVRKAKESLGARAFGAQRARRCFEA